MDVFDIQHKIRRHWVEYERADETPYIPAGYGRMQHITRAVPTIHPSRHVTAHGERVQPCGLVCCLVHLLSAGLGGPGGDRQRRQGMG